ncbi:MAG TPA: hypothetical protein DDY78_24600 [Planctomycetales bacterium]|nr:hypothetical protein [Planctomycetales bacterium]
MTRFRERRQPYLELVGESHFLQARWKLAECDHVLSEGIFPSTWSGGKTGEIDVTQAGRVELKHFTNELHEQMALVTGEPGWDTPALVNWLDRNIRHLDVPQVQSSLFIHRLVSDLMESRKVTVEQLARLKYRLRNAIEEKIGQLRGAHRQQAYQAYLFGPQTALVEVDPASCFEFDVDRYAPNWFYDGHYRFQRHYVPPVGELKGEGEEYECAVRLDQMDEVEVWMRNLAGRPETSFWLPTSTDRFYPDFVAKLRDGRILVVEYKGDVYWSNDDSKEKRALGELYAERSGGRCLFVMPNGPDWRAMSACVGNPQ